MGIDVDNGVSIIESIEFLCSICIGGVVPIVMSPVECLRLYDLSLAFSFSSSICSIVSSFLDDFLALLRRFPIVDCFFLENCYGLLLRMVILLIFCMVILVHANPWDYNPCECLSFQIWYEILYNENPCEWSLKICIKLLLNYPYQLVSKFWLVITVEGSL